MKSYIQQIRTKIGHDKFIHPGARIIIENKHGEILFVMRKDNGKLGLPAGALEEGETIEQCIIREVKEESGLELITVEVIGISTDPNKEIVCYPNGDVIQYFVVEFFADSWTGDLKVGDDTEIKSAIFKSKKYLEHLPVNEKGIVESWQYYQKNKKIRLG